MNIRKMICLIEHERKEQLSIYHSVAAKYNLSYTTLWILYYISEFDEDQTQQDLCRHVFHAKQTINTAIAGLAKNGFVELISVPGTRNHKKIHLTPKGLNLVNQTTRHLKKAEENAYARLSEDELKTYLKTAGKLNTYLWEEIEKL